MKIGVEKFAKTKQESFSLLEMISFALNRFSVIPEMLRSYSKLFSISMSND